MATLRQVFEEHARSWRGGEGCFAVSHGPKNTDKDLESARQELLASEGRTPSLVVDYEYPAGGPTILDVLEVSRLLTSQNSFMAKDTKVLWAPSPADCEQARTPSKFVASRLLLPKVTGAVMAAAKNVVPEELWPAATAKKDELVKRIATSQFLDDAQVPWKGRGDHGRRVPLNTTAQPQPRRSSRSVRGSPACEGLEKMYHYSAYRREAADSYCRRMTAPEMDLACTLWLAARPHLSAVSQSCVFNQVQLLFYYGAFGNKMAQHRDNNSKRQLSAVLAGEQTSFSLAGSCTGVADQTCQVPGSSVAVFTMGTRSMTMKLRFPPPDDLECNIKKYVVHPAFTLRLHAGTLFILDPHDDVFFTHEAEFTSDCAGDNDDGLRIAWVFRHCQVLHPYGRFSRQRYIAAEELEEQRKAKKKRKARESSNRRRRLLQSTA